ncbi:hypothetical protein J4Q44_G00032540 [Coregonus suidteri]|uniref:Uncharacterized protein n=1 Tax=Coregonus suidteri TaxID=861788 RepID=A0AAN8MC12_9TELE
MGLFEQQLSCRERERGMIVERVGEKVRRMDRELSLSHNLKRLKKSVGVCGWMDHLYSHTHCHEKQRTYADYILLYTTEKTQLKKFNIYNFLLTSITGWTMGGS